MEEPSTKPFVVSVEGNIGSGKSSMLKCFENMSETVTTVPGENSEFDILFEDADL